MTRDEADAQVKWFAQLFPQLTPQQVRTLRDEIADSDDVKKGFTVTDFQAAAREAVLETPYPNEAITKVMARLRVKSPTNMVQATAQMREEVRRAGEVAKAEREADDAIIAAAPEDVVYELAFKVLEGLSEDMAKFLKAKGYLVRPAWRGLVANALRASLIGSA